MDRKPGISSRSRSLNSIGRRKSCPIPDMSKLQKIKERSKGKRRKCRVGKVEKVLEKIKLPMYVCSVLLCCIILYGLVFRKCMVPSVDQIGFFLFLILSVFCLTQSAINIVARSIKRQHIWRWYLIVEIIAVSYFLMHPFILYHELLIKLAVSTIFIIRIKHIFGTSPRYLTGPEKKSTPLEFMIRVLERIDTNYILEDQDRGWLRQARAYISNMQRSSDFKQTVHGSAPDPDTAELVLNMGSVNTPRQLQRRPSTIRRVASDVTPHQLSPLSGSPILSGESGRLIREEMMAWEFSVHKLQHRTNGHALVNAAFHALRSHNLIMDLNLNAEVLEKLLLKIESSYNDTPYHNSVHAADVVHTVNYCMHLESLTNRLTKIDKLAGIIGAAIHDVDHPGRTNAFFVATRHPLAIRYNDRAVLENYHAATGIQLIEESHLLEDFETDQIKEIRETIIHMVLCTDMSQHWSLMDELKRLINPESSIKPLDAIGERRTILAGAIHIADMANPMYAWKVSQRWSRCLLEEFFSQGDEESKFNLPVGVFNDRKNASIPKCQTGFISYIVIPTVELFTTLAVELKPVIDNVKSNHDKWIEMQKTDPCGQKWRESNPLDSFDDSVPAPHGEATKRMFTYGMKPATPPKLRPSISLTPDETGKIRNGVEFVESESETDSETESCTETETDTDSEFDEESN
eukprot:TRINITY_DN3401_c0_g1_i1.p1 TRINITY_DN3401_c0_g1~~TRINITY_DN3401_c0_g1_i1.p1  ORF type:complete len:689 (-),score=127.19 TRINITY_DN3401_c0_g1_i1:441-2507(-)